MTQASQPASQPASKQASQPARKQIADAVRGQDEGAPLPYQLLVVSSVPDVSASDALILQLAELQ
jgi:hypothetical protein